MSSNVILVGVDFLDYGQGSQALISGMIVPFHSSPPLPSVFFYRCPCFAAAGVGFTAALVGSNEFWGGEASVLHGVAELCVGLCAVLFASFYFH